MTEREPEKRPKRPPRQIKAASQILEREAQRIVRKFAARIAPEPLEQIRASAARASDRRAAADWASLEVITEELDELLHQHASFARKSALRETLENVGVAVMVALALRSCVYEPFKIPSGSMMPTLRAGDHIFVNKFVYGVQIPFTNTVVGESLGAIRRGDVVVFRYPIDENEDFIKRVIGLPGDTIRVDGEKVAIRRAGDADFEELALRRLDDERCTDETGTKPITGCAHFEETLDGRTHVVRYMSGDPRLGVQRRQGEWTVPDGHLLVMGDNRNQSHDSLAWTRQVEAVAADGLLTLKDLRDLTAERLFTLQRPEDAARQDPAFDRITYVADHRAEPRDLELEIWRDPTLGAEAVFAAHAAAQGGAPASIAALVEATPRYATGAGAGRPRERLLELSAAITALSLAEDPIRRDALVHLGDAKAVLRLRCGLAACREPIDLIERLAAIVEAFDHDHEQDARQLLEGERGIRYSNHWTSRSSDRFVERRFARSPGAADDPAARVRLRIWRDPDEGVAAVRDAALWALAGDPARAVAAPDLGADAWITSDERRHAAVVADPSGVVFALECGRQRCSSASDVQALAAAIAAKTPTVAKDRRALEGLLAPSDLGSGWRDLPIEARTRHEYDRTRMEGTERTITHSVELSVWRRPAQGLDAAVAELARVYPGVEEDASVQPGGRYAALSDRHALVFAVPSSDAVIQLECRRGLCDGRDTATALGRRIADKARDAGNFVDPSAERASPFVPRGHVKGRADRIWLPLRRFWLPIQ